MPDTPAGFQPRDRQRPQPEEMPLRIIHEDDCLLVLDKPAGLVVHPTYKNTSGTLLNGVLWRYRGRADVQPGILTRLDKGTSGVVLVALTPGLHAVLQRRAGAGGLHKEYLAVVHGTPEPARGTIDLPLARDPGDRRRVVVSPAGAPSRTRYEVIDVAGPRTLVRCELVTGRTHQIRVHLAASGWPIIGDPVYGEPDPGIGRQALHAWRLAFEHPATGMPLRLESPAPPELTAALRPS